MANNSGSSIEPIPVEHCGSYIYEELQARGWSVSDLARKTRLPWELWARFILNDEPWNVTAPMFLRLGEAFGTSPELWVNLHCQWRDAQHG